MNQAEPEKMEISSRDSEKLKQEERKQMSDVATANFLVEQIGNKRHIGDMLHTAWRELSRRFPHWDDPENRWTERRLKAWRNNESQIVKHFQMMELFETAEALRSAREAHAEFKAKTEHLRKMAKLRAAGSNRDLASR
ncbi:hypothetical protein [Rhizobium sp. CNPSo 4062]|uniref:hypothetical protein n=1 Tax=Rhizobium sp. CNPSo 4062 TaxID=3021410 RepID=UPI00254C704C|nr:hypothetical protein [Rhizobium sp. CNPSo 4062]